MDSSTKKIMYYTGGAILVGAIGFFVYSFFKKDDVVEQEFAYSEEETNSSTTKGSFIAPKMDFSQNIDWTPTPLSDLWKKK